QTNFFIFNPPATTDLSTLSLHDALPISCRDPEREERQERGDEIGPRMDRLGEEPEAVRRDAGDELDGDQHRGGDDRAERRSPLRSEEHTSELQSRGHLVCRLLLEKKKRD